MKRRDFLQKNAALGAALMLPKTLDAFSPKKGLDYKIGFQSWVVRKELNADFQGTMAKMVAQGYESMELCSPPGYKMAGFKPLLKMKIGDMRDQIIDAGLECKSCHFTMAELRKNPEQSMDFAGIMKFDRMMISSFGIGKDEGLDAWKSAADEANALAVKVKERGMQLGFHNHNQELEELEGEIIYDVLLDRLDPDLVKMQFQCWVIVMGVKAADYFRKHPGRFVSAHLSDWNGEVEEQVALGSGATDWVDFLEAAKVGGMKDMYVEMSPEVLEESAAYLKGLGEKG